MHKYIKLKEKKEKGQKERKEKTPTPKKETKNYLFQQASNFIRVLKFSYKQLKYIHLFLFSLPFITL